MRIAVHSDGPRIRGSERQLLLLVEGLLARGHEVAASCLADGPVRRALDALGVETTGIRPRGDADVFSALAFAYWLRRRRTEALLMTSWKRVFIGGWSARLAGVPQVVMRVGGLRGPELGPGARLRRWALAHWYHLVVANSPRVRDQMLADNPGLRPEAVAVIPNGVAFEPAPAAPLRSELGIPDAAPLVVTVTGLERNKGTDRLPALLAGQAPDVHLVVAGAGTAAQRDALLAAAAERGVAERFHLVGHRDDVAAVLAAADAFVLPSRADSTPNAMLEAMAAGLPVVMTPVGGVERALGARDGRPPAGWIADPSEGALARCVAEVVEDLRAGGVEAGARGREARWRVEHWFPVDAMVSGYEAALAGLGSWV